MSGFAIVLALCAGTTAAAQTPPQGTASITGRVLDAATGAALPGTLVVVEGGTPRALADSAGRFVLRRVSAGPHVLRAERLGYASTRVNIVVPAAGLLTHDIPMAISALVMPGVIVTADPVSRARGELGTASVIEREAIRHQTAASLAGVLELVPGVVVRPPGLDNVQQFALRSAPLSTLPDNAGVSGANLTTAGTLIVLDGVPLSNNANLQSLGPRGELALTSSGGGGVDLRRIPAAIIDRVDVIRGIPSARYGDLTQGAVIVDTRAGAVDTEISVRRDRHTTEASIIAGSDFGAVNTGTVLLNAAQTWLAPGNSEDKAYRIAGQFAHRLRLGQPTPDDADARFTLDTRLDYFQVFQDAPEDPEIRPGSASRNRDSGVRLSQRARLPLDGARMLEFYTSLDRQQQRSFSQGIRTRPALPFTSRITAGRAIGHYIAGSYTARVDVDGDPWLVFGRVEASDRSAWAGLEHSIRAGAELRREWNSGPGYQFDIEFPPQVTFNGVEGFDRPRRYDAVPPVAMSSLYVDDHFSGTLPGGIQLLVQAGLRLDVLHNGTSWLSRARHAVPQPRINVQLAPWPALRLRAGAGRTTKYPTLAQFHPSPQYHDLVNVNWYAPEPEERLAVLTTFVLERANPALRQPITDKAEAGFELALGPRGVFSFVAFRDRVNGAIGFERSPLFLLRDRFQLSDSTLGTGRPPQIIEPPFTADTIPVLLLRPANTLTLDTRGYEITLALPELSWLSTRLEVQAALIRSRLQSNALEVGTYFSDFQLTDRRQRTPYWAGSAQTGERVLVNYRIIHQQPSVGLVITTTVQHTWRELRHNIAGTDTLSFAGYITRTGATVPVPAPERARPEYRDLQLPRRNIFTDRISVLPDWLLSLQVSKTLPLDGRLAFYAFNALDRVGRYAEMGVGQRIYPSMRFGLEVSLMPGALLQ